MKEKNIHFWNFLFKKKLLISIILLIFGLIIQILYLMIKNVQSLKKTLEITYFISEYDSTMGYGEYGIYIERNGNDIKICKLSKITWDGINVKEYGIQEDTCKSFKSKEEKFNNKKRKMIFSFINGKVIAVGKDGMCLNSKNCINNFVR